MVTCVPCRRRKERGRDTQLRRRDKRRRQKDWKGRRGYQREAGVGVEERKGRRDSVSKEKLHLYVCTYAMVITCVGKEARLAAYPKEACNGGHMVDTSAFH